MQLLLPTVFLASLGAFLTLRVEHEDPGKNAHQEIVIDGRSAFVYTPPGLRNKSSDIVIALHGCQGAAHDVFHVGFETHADRHGFRVVYPEMSKPHNATWGYKGDLPFFRRLSMKLREPPWNVGGRFFAYGHSAGGAMALFLQNELPDIISRAGVVGCGVENLHLWDLSKPGVPTLLIWNRNDPIIYGFWGGEVLLNQTLGTLRRKSMGKELTLERMQLPTNKEVVAAEMTIYRTPPELRFLSWLSAEPGSHAIPWRPWASFDAVAEIVAFFLDLPLDALNRSHSL